MRWGIRLYLFFVRLLKFLAFLGLGLIRPPFHHMWTVAAPALFGLSVGRWAVRLACNSGRYSPNRNIVTLGMQLSGYVAQAWLSGPVSHKVTTYLSVTLPVYSYMLDS